MSEENLDLVDAPVADHVDPVVVSENDTPVPVEEEIVVEETPVEPKEDKLPKGIERRFAKLTKQKHEDRHRIEQLEAQLAQREAAQQPVKTREDFTEDEWIEYVAEQKATKLLRDRDAASAQAREQEALAAEASTAWQAKISRYQEEMPDWAEVVGSADVDLPVEAIQYMNDSEVGPRMAYHLAQNPEEAERIAEMPERRRELAIIKLEMQMEAKAATAPQNLEVTKAVPTPRGGGRPGGKSNMDAMSMDDWMKARNNQLYGKN